MKITQDDVNTLLGFQRWRVEEFIARRPGIEYLELRDKLGLSDGNVWSHLRALEHAGMIRVMKGFKGRKTVTTYSLTAKGRASRWETMKFIEDPFALFNGGCRLKIPEKKV